MSQTRWSFRRGPRSAHVMVGLGAVTLAAGAIVAPERTWPALLLVSQYVLGLGLAGIFFVALQYLAGATWAVALRRVPEAMSGVLPAGAVLIGLLLVGAVGLHPLYPWMDADAGLLHGFKGAWLTRAGLLLRAVVYLAAWLTLSAAIVGTSRRQDEDGDVTHTQRNQRLSGVFMVVFALTLWLASVDWIMSLEPEWYSTMFGLYNFASLFLSGIAAMIVLTIWLQGRGLGRVVSHEHLHDLGKLLFAFSSFWMYIWFCQYMLIWFVNLPEETTYYVRRLQPGWQPVVFLVLLLNWVIPFLVLMPRAAKRRPGVLVKVAAVVLVGRWVDLYLMIVPATAGASPVFGVWEIGVTLGGVGLFILAFRSSWDQAPPVPRGDPQLAASLGYHA